MSRTSRRPCPHPRVRVLFAALLWCLFAGAAGAVDLSGSWSGSWQSCTTGHSGPLAARFTPCGDAAYRVEFSGRFFRVVPFRYTVVLDVVADSGDAVTLAGRSYLGRLFGTFTYTATADGCRFDAAYRSRKDSGAFRMTRNGG